MEKFEFYQDVKVTAFERDYFTVEAETYEEAEAIIRSWNNKDVFDVKDPRLCLGYAVTIKDTTEHMTPEENGGCSTLMICNDRDEIIAENEP